MAASPQTSAASNAPTAATGRGLANWKPFRRPAPLMSLMNDGKRNELDEYLKDNGFNVDPDSLLNEASQLTLRETPRQDPANGRRRRHSCTSIAAVGVTASVGRRRAGSLAPASAAVAASAAAQPAARGAAGHALQGQLQGGRREQGEQWRV